MYLIFCNTFEFICQVSKYICLFSNNREKIFLFGNVLKSTNFIYIDSQFYFFRFSLIFFLNYKN